MRNKFAGKCYVCGESVKVGAGHFERKKGGWRVRHEYCHYTINSPRKLIIKKAGVNKLRG